MLARSKLCFQVIGFLVLVGCSCGSRLQATQFHRFKANQSLHDNAHAKEELLPLLALPLLIPAAGATVLGTTALPSAPSSAGNTLLRQLRDNCERYESLEQKLPTSIYGEHAIRMPLGDAMLVVRDADFRRIDLSSTFALTSMNAGLLTNIAIHGNLGCDLKHPSKAPPNAGCVDIRLRNLSLIQNATMLVPKYEHFDEIVLRVALAADMSLEFVPTPNKSRRGITGAFFGRSKMSAETFTQKLTVSNLDFYVEQLTLFGGYLGIKDSMLLRIIRSGLIKRQLLSFLKTTFDAVVGLPEVQRQVLAMELLDNTSVKVKLTDIDCTSSGVAAGTVVQHHSTSGLCLSFEATMQGKIDSGRVDAKAAKKVVQSIVSSASLNCTDETASMIASLLPLLIRSSVANSMDASVTSTGDTLQTSTNSSTSFYVEDLLEYAGATIQNPKLGARNSLVYGFMQKHSNSNGWLSFAVPVGSNGLAFFIAGFWRPAVVTDAAVGVSFAQLPGGTSGWQIKFHSNSNKSMPLDVNIGADRFDCTYSTGLNWEICDMLGQPARMHLELSGSLVLTEEAELVVCVKEPCAAGLEEIRFAVDFSSDHVPTLKISPQDGTIFASVKLSPLIAPLFRVQQELLLHESLNGPFQDSVQSDAAASDVRNVLLRAAKNRCGLGIGQAIGNAIKTGIEDFNISWTPGPERQAKDARQMNELANTMARKNSQPAKNSVFVRFDPQQGDIEMLSWSTAGVTADITLRAWQPDLNDESADMAWLHRMGFTESIEQVQWILELGGPHIGSKATVEAVMEDLYISHWMTRKALNQVSYCDGERCLTGAAVDLSMRFLMLSDGSLHGCFGSCCSDSVDIGKISIKDFGSIRLSLLGSVVKGVQGIIGSFIPELLGRMLPGLLEIPIKAALSNFRDRMPADRYANSTTGAHVSFRVKLSHDLDQDIINVKISPEAHLTSEDIGLDLLGTVRTDADGLVYIRPSDKVALLITSFLRPGIEHCRETISANCAMTAGIPIEFTMEPERKRMSIRFKGMDARAHFESIALLISMMIAQPNEAIEDINEGFCLSDLDSNRSLARNMRQFAPLSRTPVFEAPLDSLQDSVALRASISVNVNMIGREDHASHSKATRTFTPFAHSLNVIVNGQFRVQDHSSFFLPWYNSAAVADFGFLHFRGNNFVRLNHGALYNSRSTVKEVAVRCGSLLLDGFVKVDLTDSSVKLTRAKGSKKYKCVKISRRSTRAEYMKINGVSDTKPYTLCSQNALDMQRFSDAIRLELARQAGFRAKTLAAGTNQNYTCSLPLATNTVHAQPAKARAFRWESNNKSDNGSVLGAPPSHCLELCANHPACEAVAHMPRMRFPCRFYGHFEVLHGRLQSTPGVWRKIWNNLQDVSNSFDAT